MDKKQDIKYYGEPKKKISQQKNDNMEHWVAEEQNTWKPQPPEIRVEKMVKKNDQSKDKKMKTEGKRRSVLDELDSTVSRLPPPFKYIVQGPINQFKKFRKRTQTFCNHVGVGKNKVAPITSKVQARHLELEPLCCLSSCLVRGGCMGVVAFEAFYVAATLLCIISRFFTLGHFHMWRPFEQNFNAYVTHPLFFYIVLAFDVITLFMAFLLTRGLFRFDKNLLFYHYRYDFFALVFNIIAFFLYSLAISSKGPSHWDLSNTLLLINFAIQIPVQLWAISVVKSCADFFALIQVFVSLAEA